MKNTRIGHNRPKSIKILGKTYAVSWQTPPREQGEPDYLGRCYNDTNHIYVEPKMPQDQILDTLLHEITHAVSAQLSLDLDEPTVHRLATGLAAVILDNPGLFHGSKR